MNGANVKLLPLQVGLLLMNYNEPNMYIYIYIYIYTA